MEESDNTLYDKYKIWNTFCPHFEMHLISLIFKSWCMIKQNPFSTVSCSEIRDLMPSDVCHEVLPKFQCSPCNSRNIEQKNNPTRRIVFRASRSNKQAYVSSTKCTIIKLIRKRFSTQYNTLFSNAIFPLIKVIIC